ncbi:MAG: ATP-binding protein, partial [Deltaproteobacteria bacterium]|nr:ATP-binding protein [Deltaproteobacteria bacterium]
MNSSASLAIDASLNPARQEIRILSDVIVDQIAAGEVVERPASVVKELVENSIDAGATTVTVVLGNGGHASLEVIDDGLGMTEAEARVAVQRFGTSKISTIDDLQSIATFGFRGEALPSIAAVSRFSLSTCARSPDAKPVQLDIEGGKLLHVGSSAVAGGTRITVSQLFYNTPARRKFLRSPRTEIGVVRTLMLDFAAAYPSIRFTLVADGEELLSLPSESTFQSRARSLRLAGDDPLELDQIVLAPAGNYHLTGFLSKPRDAAAGANKLRLLVNGRSVRDRLLLRAVR